MKRGEPYRAPRAITPPEPVLRLTPASMVRFPGGRVPIGTDDRRVAYDNERPRHVVDVAAFRIDVTPVTNAQYSEFIADGGYSRRELWSEPGWAWRQADGAEAPKYWFRDGATWHSRVFDRTGPVAPDHPVCHVSYHEADAFARWAGKRLPTEVEWETAASFDPATGEHLEFPWGDGPWSPALANLDQLSFGTSAVGAYARNVSPLGCYGMIGDVWEWTSSDFRGYPGYETFPYPEYSEVFFGTEYKVLRGGAFATRPGAIRNTFRNWDYPIRRQIFSGFRCASDD
jgi:iron(II)-dependent oxidoreductase